MSAACRTRTTLDYYRQGRSMLAPSLPRADHLNKSSTRCRDRKHSFPTSGGQPVHGNNRYCAPQRRNVGMPLHTIDAPVVNERRLYPARTSHLFVSLSSSRYFKGHLVLLKKSTNRIKGVLAPTYLLTVAQSRSRYHHRGAPRYQSGSIYLVT